MIRTAPAFAALAGALLAAQPLAAASVEVPYDDLDLSSAEGRRELDRRIDRAAAQACGASDALVGSRVRPREVRDCMRQARRQIEAGLAKITGAQNSGG